jgi:putative membrane protein insertion efficiency factor
MFQRLPRRVLIAVIRVYQYFLSPFFGQHCRFHPTCSHYAVEAIEVHGAWFGCILALRRIARCHPLNEGGVDLVPGIAGRISEPPRHGSGSC